MPHAFVLPVSQVKEHFDEQSTEHLQLQFSRGQAILNTNMLINAFELTTLIFLGSV